MSYAIHPVLIVLCVLLGPLTLAAGLTWVERRLLGFFQDRAGPNRLGPFGILQSLADGVKIIMKEDWVPPFADRPVFVLAPAVALGGPFMALAVVVFGPGFAVVDLNVGVLFFLAMTALSAYSVIMAGWASNSKFPLIGGLRSAAQMLSYEVFMGLSLLGVVLLAGSFRLKDIVDAQAGLWYCVPQFPAAVVFFIAGVAQTHRLPFDLPEAESELVAGYHTEYSGLKFALFLFGEYVAIMAVSALTVTLFLGGWRGPWLPAGVWFLLKVFVLVAFFILMRAALPRPRYDQLMALGWKLLLPLALLNLVVTGGILLLTGG